MHKPSVKNIAKRVLQIGLPIVILAYFVLDVKKEWSQLAAHPIQWNLWLLLLAFAGFLLQVLSYGVIWRTVLARLGAHLNFRTSLRIYLASEFVRYIPGNIWHVLTRILWVGKYGVSRPVAFASMTIELITKLAAGAFIFALSLLFWSDSGAVHSFVYAAPLLVAAGIASVLVLLIILHPRILNALLNTALRIMKREPITLPLRYRDILLVTLSWTISWLIAGTAFYVLVLAVYPTLPLAALPICIGIYALAWDVGFVSFITPSGLGFREGTIAFLLVLALPTLPVVWGPILAIVSRLISTVAELVCVSVAYLSGGKQMREVQQEQDRLGTQAQEAQQASEQPLSESVAPTARVVQPERAAPITSSPVQGGVPHE